MAETSPYRILVIDDEQVVLDASARLLSAEGFEVVTALDGEIGLVVCESTLPDIAIVDLKLPGMSGLDFMDAAISQNPALIIILTTGVAGAEQAVAALNHGAFDFLPKPFTYEELMSPIVRASRFRQSRGSSVGRSSSAADLHLLHLGLQAWALPEANASIRLGVTELFQATAGKALEVIPPKIDAEIRQGSPIARVRTEDARWHVALAAAGGRIVKVNSNLFDSPGLLNTDPFGRGWIAVVESTDLRHDLPNLQSPGR